jgi:hypothetical protein
LNLYYRIPNAAGMVGSFRALYVGRDCGLRRVCVWWDQKTEQLIFIWPRGGRWLRRTEPPRTIGEFEMRGVKESARRHADWLRESEQRGIVTKPIGSLPARR